MDALTRNAYSRHLHRLQVTQSKNQYLYRYIYNSDTNKEQTTLLHIMYNGIKQEQQAYYICISYTYTIYINKLYVYQDTFSTNIYMKNIHWPRSPSTVLAGLAFVASAEWLVTWLVWWSRRFLTNWPSVISVFVHRSTHCERQLMLAADEDGDDSGSLSPAECPSASWLRAMM